MNGFWLMLLGIVAGTVAAKLGEAWNSDIPFGIMVGAWVMWGAVLWVGSQ